jgi:hypothetical protein
MLTEEQVIEKLKKRINATSTTNRRQYDYWWG